MKLLALQFSGSRWDALFGASASLPARIVSTLCLVVAAAALGYAAWRSVDLRLLRSDVLAQLQAAESGARAGHPPAAPPLPAVPAAQRSRINAIVRSLNTRWSNIFDALEDAALPDVFVLAIEPDGERGVVRLRTEGSDIDQLFEHARRVQGGPHLLHARLQRIETDEVTSARRLDFEVELSR